METEDDGARLRMGLRPSMGGSAARGLRESSEPLPFTVGPGPEGGPLRLMALGSAGLGGCEGASPGALGPRVAGWMLLSLSLGLPLSAFPVNKAES